MKIGITNLYYCTNICHIAWMMVSSDIRLQDAIFEMIIFKRKIIRISCVVNNHVVEYNTCFHDHSQFTSIHVSSRATDDGESRL